MGRRSGGQLLEMRLVDVRVRDVVDEDDIARDRGFRRLGQAVLDGFGAARAAVDHGPVDAEPEVSDPFARVVDPVAVADDDHAVGEIDARILLDQIAERGLALDLDELLGNGRAETRAGPTHHQKEDPLVRT